MFMIIIVVPVNRHAATLNFYLTRWYARRARASKYSICRISESVVMRRSVDDFLHHSAVLFHFWLVIIQCVLCVCVLILLLNFHFRPSMDVVCFVASFPSKRTLYVFCFFFSLTHESGFKFGCGSVLLFLIRRSMFAFHIAVALPFGVIRSEFSTHAHLNV